MEVCPSTCPIVSKLSTRAMHQQKLNTRKGEESVSSPHPRTSIPPAVAARRSASLPHSWHAHVTCKSSQPKPVRV